MICRHRSTGHKTWFSSEISLVVPRRDKTRSTVSASALKSRPSRTSRTSALRMEPLAIGRHRPEPIGKFLLSLLGIVKLKYEKGDPP
eukprot:3727829-Rhodomonas_salina.2